MKGINISLTKIIRNENQPRKQFNEDSIKELSESIKKDGLMQPITVREVSRDTFEIVQGERRYRACKLAGLSEIPAIIKELDDEEAFHLSVIENIQREDMTPIEEALAFQKYVEMGYTHKEIAEKISKGRTYVTQRLRLLKLIPEVQDMIAIGVIQEGHAKQLLKLENIFKGNNNPFQWGQELFIHEFSKVEKISVNDVREFVNKVEQSITVSVLNIFFISEKINSDAAHWLELVRTVDVRILDINESHIEKACCYEVENLAPPKSGKKSELHEKIGNVYKKYESIKETLGRLSDDEKTDRWAERATQIYAFNIQELFDDIEKSKSGLVESYIKASDIQLSIGNEDSAKQLKDLAESINKMTFEEFTDYFLEQELQKLGVNNWSEAIEKVSRDTL